MDEHTRTGRRRFAQGGGAALALVALQSALGGASAAQDATPGAITMSSDTATPPADCEGQDQVAQNLETFDRLDFEAWNEQNWELFAEIHGENVHVEGWGTNTDGVDVHVEWSKEFTAANPDSYRIVDHPIRIGAGDWTAVTGVLEDGSIMATFARWENGQITEEYLFSLT